MKTIEEARKEWDRLATADDLGGETEFEILRQYPELCKEFNRPEPPPRPHTYSDGWRKRPASGAEVMDLLDTFVAGTTDERERQAIRRAMSTIREVLGPRLPKQETGYVPTYSVVGVILDDSGQVLAISRKDNDHDFGLPGGKIEPGEMPMKALVRELREELGIEVVKADPVFEHLDRVEKGERRPCMAFLVHEYTGEPRSMEGQKVEWCPPKRLLEGSCTFREYNHRLFGAIGHVLRARVRKEK